MKWESSTWVGLGKGCLPPRTSFDACSRTHLPEIYRTHLPATGQLYMDQPAIGKLNLNHIEPVFDALMPSEIEFSVLKISPVEIQQEEEWFS